MVAASAVIGSDGPGTLPALTPKGGGMLIRCSHVLVVPLVFAALIATGCAKRPATTQASAPPAPTPPPSAAAPSPTPGGGGPSMAAPTTPGRPGGPGAGGPSAAAPGARPSPREFMAIPELKDVFFDFDKYDIRPGDAKTLDANADWLKKNTNHLVLIEGHCDERGTNEYNLALGERRAKATMNYLVSQGVQASRITIISYGEERPQCTDKNEACWGKNRRGHFLVKPR
jgi:peptidoglycan-associated lipoprotein